jgi:hypothetical protein
VLQTTEVSALPCRPGEFRLEIDGGIGAYCAPKPALIMTSTAAVCFAANPQLTMVQFDSVTLDMLVPLLTVATLALTAMQVERNAIIGDDEVARKTDIPIVQLNPGGEK